MMNFLGRAQVVSCLFAIALGGPIPAAAQAQTPANRWTVEAAIYGWFAGIDGSTSFPSGASGPSIHVSADQLIDSLKFTFMGQLQARHGKWGVWSDLVYSDLGGSETNSRDFSIGGHPVGVDAELRFDAKSWVWTLAGLYNLESGPESIVDLLLGTRLLDQKQTLNWQLSSAISELPGRSGSSTITATNWDAVAGIKGRYAFGGSGKWFVPYYLDVGAGQSKLTWQVSVGVGYKVDWGSVFATWRYLDYRFKSGEPIDSMSMSGPVIGVAFQW